jgi:hypothetical protein
MLREVWREKKGIVVVFLTERSLLLLSLSSFAHHL